MSALLKNLFLDTMPKNYTGRNMILELNVQILIIFHICLQMHDHQFNLK